MTARTARPGRLVMPPPLTILVDLALKAGYEVPDTEEGDVTDVHGNVFPAMKVTLNGNPGRRDVQATCRVVDGPEPVGERVRWAVRSALAEALVLASSPDAVRDEAA